MRRALDRLANENFDLLVIGGGATGVCVARDAALRGLDVALIEKGDFASATSAHNSKLVHGGLRYLRNFEIGLVRESLRERRIWLRIAPHLVHPLPFLLPMISAGLGTRAVTGLGLSLYDALALGGGLPAHRWLGRKEALAREPVLAQFGLKGAFEYHDAQMVSPERLALACAMDAAAHGAALANYAAAETLIDRDGAVQACTVRDVFSGACFDVHAKTVLVAAGPWADIFLAQALGRPPAHKLLRSKGIHILVPQLSTAALAIEAGSGHFFVMPWRGHTLIGTTDSAFQGDPDSVAASESDIENFLALINRYLPAAKLARSMVEFAYAGLRPLVDDGSGDTYNASRRAELIDHGAEHGLDGLFSALGGKWTTSRALAERAVDALAAKLAKPVRACATATGKLPDAPPAGDMAAQLRAAVRDEMALTLEDAVMRRTSLGQFGRPSPQTLDEAARILAGDLGWSEERRAREIAALGRVFQTPLT